MAITLNEVTTGFSNTGAGGWLVSAYSADASGNEILKAAVTGKHHFIKKIRLHHTPGTTSKWVQINSDTLALIGPITMNDYTAFWEYEFLSPIKVPVGTGIKIDTEATTPISVIMEGSTEP